MTNVKDFSSLSFSAALEIILNTVATLAICLLVMTLINKAVAGALERSKKLNGTIQVFLLSLTKILLWIITVIIVASSLGINTSSLVALLSVAGLALSLSLQNTMSNVFSGITLIITRPFSDGDYIEVGGKAGTVSSVGMFYTVIDTLDNVRISIPNSEVTGSAVKNYSREPLRRVDMQFETSYDDPTEKVKAALLEAIAEDSRIVSEPAPAVLLSAYKSSSIEYTVRVWCKSADYWNVHFELNESVRRSFERNGVEMTYEHMNVHMV